MPEFGSATARARKETIPSELDLRPILARSDSNAWQRCEKTRQELSDALEQSCRNRGIDALVLQSNPFIHPVWVKFESWMPCEGFALTARASMLVTITPTPFRRFDTTYAVQWEKHGQSGTVGHLYRFGGMEIERMLDLLSTQPAGGLSRRQVKYILKPGQLRIHRWQIWRPKNKVVAVRRDYLKVGSWLLILAGAALTYAGSDQIVTLVNRYQMQRAESAAANDYRQAAAPASEAPSSLRTGKARPAGAPETAGQKAAAVNGVLGKAENRLPDGRFFDSYTYEKVAGLASRITMHSTQLDAFLIVGVAAEGGFRVLSTNDDANSGTTDASVLLPARLTGTITIRATSASQGEKGAYTLEVEPQ